MSAIVETPRFPISDKYRQSCQGELDVLRDALQRGLSGTSEVVEHYEADLAAWFDSQNAIAVSSGGAAISVALAAAGVGAGDEVALTPTSPLCTVYPVIAAGAVPVFVDTREHGFGMSLEDLSRVHNAKLKAIIDIPMWGYPTEVDELQACARERGYTLILDLAHAHGSTLHGKHLSHYGDISCFSTHERKPLATGEGGFLLSDRQDLADRARSYSRFGNLNGRDFGLNYKLAALPAALGQHRLRYLQEQIDARRRNAEFLLSRIHHPKVREKKQIDGGETNYYSLNLQLFFRNNRSFIDYLEVNGIPSDIKRYGCKCLYKFPAVAAYQRDCPNGDALLRGMTTIPVHPNVTEDELFYIASIVNDYNGD